MGFGTVILYFVVFVAFLLGLESILRKWLNIKKVRLSDTEAKNIDRWGRGIILIVALCFLPFTIGGNFEAMMWFWIIYLSVMTLFEAFLQWKYVRESKEYILTLIFWPLGLASMLVFAFWML